MNSRFTICIAWLLALLGQCSPASALWWGTYGTWDSQARKDAADASMLAVVNRFNVYGDFNLNNDGWVDVYYNAGVPTAQSGYNGAIEFGGTWPSERVALHESNHWLGSGTYGHTYDGPRVIAILEQFDGIGARFGTDGTHFWPYGMNYDNEWSEVAAQRNIAIMYALRGDWGIGPTSNPTAWAATNVTLTGSDAAGESGFNYGSKWSDNTFAHANADYSTGSYSIRTPQGYPSWKFAGKSLTINNGGRLLFNGWGTTSVVTINNLNLAGGTVRHDQFPQDLFQLGGTVMLASASTSTIDAANGDIQIIAPIGGGGSLTKTGAHTLTLSGGSSYSGATVINVGTLRLSPPSAVASYSFTNVSGTTVINDGAGGSSMNGTLNANGGSGFINTAGGPSAGMGALVLNGTGTTVDVNSGIVDLSGDGSWTVSAWIKTTQSGATIFNKGDGTNWNSGYSTFYLGDGSDVGSGGLPTGVRWGGGWVSGSTAVNNGLWHQLTFTNSGGAKVVYVDGVPTSLSQNQFFNPDTGSVVRIGFNPPVQNDGEQTTNGSLSGIKFFGQALSASQVTELFGSGQVSSVLPTTTDVTIASTATLDVNGANQTVGSLTGAIGSAVKLGSGGKLTVSSASSTSFAGNISGAAGAALTKSGAGILTLSGVNTYTGPTTINGGTLRLSSPAGVAAVNPIASYSFNHLAGNTVINDGSGGMSMNGTLNANGGTGSINASGGPAPGMGALVLNGSGTTVDVNSGITNLGSSSNWTVSAWIKTTQHGATILNKGDGANWNSGFSTFYLGDGSDAGSGGLPAAVRWGGGWLAGSTSVNDGNWHLLTFTDSAGVKAISVDGVAETARQNEFLNTDTGTKVRIGFAPNPGDGAQPTNGSLSGMNFYSAALSPAQVSALFGAVIGGGGASATALPTGTDVTIASGATLDVNNLTQTIASLTGPTGSALTLGTGRLTINSAASTQFAGTIAGEGGSIVKEGAGLLTFSGTNTYSGGTFLADGTLSVATNSNLGNVTGGLTFNGGTLRTTGALTTGRAVTVNSPGGVIDTGNFTTTLNGQFAATGALTKIGGGTLAIAGPQSHGSGAVLNANAGTTTLSSDAGPTGRTLTVNANATVNFAATEHLAALNVGPGVITTLTSGGGKLLATSALAVNSTATLNLSDNDMVVLATPATWAAVLADVTSKIATAFHGGLWDLPGVTSSAAASDPKHVTTLGVMLNDNGAGQPRYTTFDGQSVDTSSVLAKYTYYGDANLSGVVDGSDYAMIDNGFNFGLAGWVNGDFNYDGHIDGTDYAFIENAFNFQGGTLAGGINSGIQGVPEPSTIVLLAIAAAAMSTQLCGRRPSR